MRDDEPSGLPVMRTPFARPDLVPTLGGLRQLRRVANGTAAPDLVIRGGRVLSVHTGELLDRDVVVDSRRIARSPGRGALDSQQVLDARGLAVAPTFVDAHLHIEYTMLPPGEARPPGRPEGDDRCGRRPQLHRQRPRCPRDGLGGPDRAPLRIFQQVTPATPAFPGLERGGAVVANAEVLRRLGLSEAVALGESNPFDLGRSRPTATARRCWPGAGSPGTPPGCATSRCGPAWRPG